LNKSKPISILIFIILISIINILYQHQYVQSIKENPLQDIQTPPSQRKFHGYKAIIDLHLISKSSIWQRDPLTDLPVYSTTVRYSIWNIGNKKAENILISIKIDSEIKSEYIIDSLSPYTSIIETHNLITNYDETTRIDIMNNVTSYDSITLTIDAKLPRNGLEKEVFITPQETSVKQIWDTIESKRNFLTQKWIAIRDWVRNHITYQYESSDFWQLPKETIHIGSGDCEDFALLTASLLRCAGYRSDEVYVLLGYNEESLGHAWVKLRLDSIGIWFHLEPQQENLKLTVGDVDVYNGYAVKFEFNDVHLTELN
jgi:hypothetical protein